MNSIVIPEKSLQDHTAVLGKTGSGKTSTAKLIVEQVVPTGARVCILDPLKSDWWGLTSSADGKSPGLPFQILGGPHGHVPLHDKAGSAVAELVASGMLHLSILDMADFKAGGPVRFFNDFADTLMRKQRGVLYLVIEEAHEFAPKERSGVGEENMAVYYAKKIATAGRTKGIRLVVCSQRVQSLHNAVLGSCETLIVHRFSAPADQEPVWNWLKGNIEDKSERERIRASLRTLKNGEGWVCSSSAPLELRQFPRIRTFDNTATPTDDVHRAPPRTAPVNVDRLRELLGSAVAEAESNDPKMLRKRIADLEAQLARPRELAVDTGAIERAHLDGLMAGQAHGRHQFGELHRAATDLLYVQHEAIRAALINDTSALPDWKDATVGGHDIAAIYDRTPSYSPAPRITATPPAPRGSSIVAIREIGGGEESIGAGGKRRILTALAQYPAGLTVRKLSILVDISPKGGTWRTYMAELRGAGYIEGRGGELLRITRAGLKALGTFEPLPTGSALIDYWRNRLGDSGKRAVFDVLTKAYPKGIQKQAVAERTGIAIGGGTWRTYLAELRGLGLVEGSSELRASGDLFS